MVTALPTKKKVLDIFQTKLPTKYRTNVLLYTQLNLAQSLCHISATDLSQLK